MEITENMELGNLKVGEIIRKYNINNELPNSIIFKTS